MMTEQWTAWCDTCSLWDQRSGKKSNVKKELKSLGWVFIKDSCFCPDCTKDKTQGDVL